ncbi:FAH [Glarea lozoyensis ATCC 20868]|uniref:FAH n=1 Tax=Glarea lozoyensis (strain ATCC 20868 / MF5171) TaxID=1116229 RepID=S3DBX2_GLAL2|nr:FAH [Glarea lozoyensis ATCC 20868]EPE35220.1 FAH [Glarea lozoyensis ATCC 20868]
MAARFDRLIRFKNTAGQIYYGELGLECPASKETLVGMRVKVFGGGLPWDTGFQLSSIEEEIDEIICPIPCTPIFQCVGLNYRKHVLEAGFPIDEFPTIFTKPPDALGGPYEPIPIHASCKFMDYVAELCAIIRKDCKNVITDEAALSCILGYTAGNDISSRYWQMPERCGNQHGPSKSFDKFAPIGPTILSPRAFQENFNGLAIKTYVNEDLRQDARTDDHIFTLGKVICHISRGATLRKGTVIMTGTPARVAAFMKPPQWLKDGDVVTVKVEKIGSISNVMKFE